MKRQPESAPSISAEQAPVWKRVIAIGSITLALAGCTPNSDVEAKPTKSVTESSATPNEAEETQAPEGEENLEQLIGEHKIPAGLSDEEVSIAYIEATNEWRTSGSEEMLLREAVEADMTLDEYLPIYAKENTAIFAPALFGDDYESNPDVALLVGVLEDMNWKFLLNHLRTNPEGNDNPENIETYEVASDFSEVRKLNGTDTSRTLEITLSNTDNADMNIVESPIPATTVIQITFTDDGDFETITDTSVK